LLGVYFVKKWLDTGSKVVVGTAEEAAASANPTTAPKNWVFGFASAHVFLIAFPSLLLSITGVRYYEEWMRKQTCPFATDLPSTMRCFPRLFSLLPFQEHGQGFWFVAHV
jgi:hypothetical protein